MYNEYNFLDKYPAGNQMSKSTAEKFMQSALGALEEARALFQKGNYGIAYFEYKLAVIKYCELRAGTHHCDFAKEICDKTYNLSEEAGYHLALCCYKDFNFDEAIFVSDYKISDSTRAKALLAMCYREQTSVPLPEREYSLAYRYMIKVLRDREYAAAPKSELEESVYVAVMIHISEIYREGPTFEACLYKYGPPYKGISPDPRRAAALLRATLANTSHESNRAKLLKALSRYETKSEKSNGIKGIFKNLFG